MSILTMATPPPHPLFRNDSHWDAAQPSSDCARPRTENRSIVALPSIRQTFPELHLEGSLADGPAARPFTHRSPSVAGPGSLASPEYVHSPNTSKRRRISMEDEQLPMRSQYVPRLYRSPERPPPRQLSPPHREPPTAESWASPSRFGSSSVTPGPIEMDGRIEPRPGLPSMPPTVAKLEREPVPMHAGRESAAGTAVLDRHPAYRAPDYGYSYHHHPSRYQSLSTSSIRPHERAAFSAGGNYHAHYQDMGRQGGDVGGDAKQRKRRGNLPKETTDKLRAWFVAHLQHPYPTEDEKQELMRQTGLQMNQISNWFINARRRQLPAMINNARAETEVMNSRVGGAGGDGEILASTERAADFCKRGEGLPVSDGEGCAYDEDMSGLRKRRIGDLNRESV
ncbi:hypothetical protein CDD83_4369 [Cordyceps sp. RAO-2017]|nr:hypothetical protein CDD83_4369 [Cordyceps sp. RAO-2017]